MKFIKSKLIQKNEGRKKGKYEITLEVTDHDLEMLEDLVMTYAPFKLYDEWKILSGKLLKKGIISKSDKLDVLEFNDKYRKWLNNVFRCFCKLWEYYGD